MEKVKPLSLKQVLDDPKTFIDLNEEMNAAEIVGLRSLRSILSEVDKNPECFANDQNIFDACDAFEIPKKLA